MFRIKHAVTSFLLAALLALPSVDSAREPRETGEAPERAPENHPGTYRINRSANLYQRPSADARILRTLRAGTVVEVVEIQDQWLRVHSRKGNPDGFIRRSYADPYTRKTRRRRAFHPGIYRLTSPTIVRAEPSIDSPKVTTLREGTQVRVVAREGLWYRVESERSGRRPGWIPGIAAQRVRDIE